MQKKWNECKGIYYLLSYEVQKWKNVVLFISVGQTDSKQIEIL